MNGGVQRLPQAGGNMEFFKEHPIGYQKVVELAHNKQPKESEKRLLNYADGDDLEWLVEIFEADEKGQINQYLTHPDIDIRTLAKMVYEINRDK